MLKPGFIDLSHHNVVPESFAELQSAGIFGVVHKATEGTSFIDDKIDARYWMANDAMLCWGVYHYMHHGNISQQVDHFMTVAGNFSDDNTLFALDVEEEDITLEEVIEFMARIEGVTNHSPVLYSGHVIRALTQDVASCPLYQNRLWLAQYADAPELPNGWNKWWAWQYTDKGEAPGIQPPVDLNAFYGSEDQLLLQWSGRKHVPKPDTTVRISIDVPNGVEVEVTINGTTLLDPEE